MQLAHAMRDALVAAGYQPSTYIGSDGLYGRDDLAGLNLAEYPAVLVELGNMKNADEAAQMESPDGRATICRGRHQRDNGVPERQGRLAAVSPMESRRARHAAPSSKSRRIPRTWLVVASDSRHAGCDGRDRYVGGLLAYRHAPSPRSSATADPDPDDSPSSTASSMTSPPSQPHQTTRQPWPRISPSWKTVCTPRWASPSAPSATGHPR